MRYKRPVVFTFPASEFYDKPLIVWNSSDRPSFVDLGINRISIGVGEERQFHIPNNATYAIGFGFGVRLAEVRRLTS